MNLTNKSSFNLIYNKLKFNEAKYLDKNNYLKINLCN